MSGNNGSLAGFGRRRVMVLIRKEWRQALRDTSALVPVILFPVFFSIILPGAAVGLIAHSVSSETRIHGLESFLDLVASVSGAMSAGALFANLQATAAAGAHLDPR